MFRKHLPSIHIAIYNEGKHGLQNRAPLMLGALEILPSHILLTWCHWSSLNLDFSVGCPTSQPSLSFWSKGAIQRATCRERRQWLNAHMVPKSCNSQGLRGPLPLCPTIAQILLTMVSCWQQYWRSVKMKGEGERNMKFIKTSFLFKSSQIKFLSRPSRHPMVCSSLWEE